VAELKTGNLAPDFRLLDDRSTEVRLSGLCGRPAVLLVYLESSLSGPMAHGRAPLPSSGR